MMAAADVEREHRRLRLPEQGHRAVELRRIGHRAESLVRREEVEPAHAPAEEHDRLGSRQGPQRIGDGEESLFDRGRRCAVAGDRRERRRSGGEGARFEGERVADGLSQERAIAREVLAEPRSGAERDHRDAVFGAQRVDELEGLALHPQVPLDLGGLDVPLEEKDDEAARRRRRFGGSGLVRLRRGRRLGRRRRRRLVRDPLEALDRHVMAVHVEAEIARCQARDGLARAERGVDRDFHDRHVHLFLDGLLRRPGPGPRGCREGGADPPGDLHDERNEVRGARIPALVDVIPSRAATKDTVSPRRSAFRRRDPSLRSG